MFVKLAAYFTALVTRDRAERELDEELQFHVEMETEANIKRGMTPRVARREAVIALGGIDQTREHVSQVRTTFLDSLAQDVRFAVRSFRRTPGFAAVVILTMAVAIGASIAVFSVVEATLLRPLPYEDPASLCMVWTAEARSHRSHNTSYPDFVDWRAQSRAFTGLAAFHLGSLTLTGSSEPERVEILRSSPNLFSLLGVQPLLGRALTDGDGPHAAMLTHHLWTRRFAGDGSVVGREVHLDGRPYIIVGVLPPEFHFPPYRIDGEPDVIVPLEQQVDRDIFFLGVVGRLRPGVPLPDAQRDVDGIAARIDAGRAPGQRGRGANVIPLQSYARLGAKHTTLTLAVAVALVLLIACANVANLLLARGSARQPELAVRAALGAGRLRLVRQLLTESLLLTAVGGGAGIVLARWCLPLLMATAPPRTQLFTRLQDAGLQMNGTVLVFAAAVSVLTGLAFGVAPAVRSVRALGGSAGSRTTTRLRGTLILVEVALSFVLLAGAGLMLRSVARLVGESPGFRTERLLTARLSVPETPVPAERAGFFRTVLAKAERLPGVESAALVVNLPLTRSWLSNSVEVEGASVREGSASYDSVSPRYFSTMGMPLLRGRTFTEADSETAPPVVVINQAMARGFWPGTDPIGKAILAARAVVSDTPAGKHLRFVQDRCEVVGIVGDAKQLGLDAPPTAAVFFPYAQRPSADMTLVLRTVSTPSLLAPALAREVRRIDASLPLTKVRTMDEWVALEAAPRRFLLVLLAGFALVAGALAAIGIYGVGAYTVSRQVREIGIRLALGAERRGIVVLVLREQAPWIAGGLAVGALCAWGLTRLLTSYLYGVQPGDLLTFTTVGAALSAAALTAQAPPVRRATRIDPATALRSE